MDGCVDGSVRGAMSYFNSSQVGITRSGSQEIISFGIDKMLLTGRRASRTYRCTVNTVNGDGLLSRNTRNVDEICVCTVSGGKPIPLMALNESQYINFDVFGSQKSSILKSLLIVSLLPISWK